MVGVLCSRFVIVCIVLMICLWVCVMLWCFMCCSNLSVCMLLVYVW